MDRADRQNLLKQKGALIWFTGRLSGSGKSTIAFTLEHALVQRGDLAYSLDGDNIRFGLNKNLGFSPEDRADRDAARETIGASDFFEIFVDTPLAVCKERDPKGLYKKARAGKIKSFTGIDAPYEVPDRLELVINTSKVSPQEASISILEMLVKAGKIPAFGN